ncbi:hypothetical protein HY640_02375 [Candidatus Woesearchaeota archaeon]|nr:hypothetical protein [Candidatus Woesearchaeota archaeon]
MNKLVFALFASFAVVLLSLSAFAVSVSRDMPARVSPGESVTVVFNVADAQVGKLFTVEDDLPEDWKFVSWEVVGAKEDKASINHRAAPGNRHGWSFTPNSGNVQVAYVVLAAQPEKSYDFDAVWFDESGFNRDKRSVVVRVLRCGDAVCEGAENNNVCPADCPVVEQPPAQPEPSQPVVQQPVAEEKGNSGVLLIVLAVIVALGVAGFFFMRRKQ